MSMKFSSSHLTENDCDEHFPKSLFYGGCNFLGGWKYTKEKHGNCKLHASQI